MESSKPKKTRKWHYTKPLHRRTEDFSIHLSEKLRKSLSRRSLEAKKDDTVKVMRGNEKFAGKQGKITSVDRHRKQVFIEGITRKKTDGKEVQIPFRPSNLMIVSIDDSDKRRMKKRKNTEKKQEGEKAGAGAGKTGETEAGSPKKVTA